ncbi:MAG: hypothetical protein D6785_04695 [Planctomycetota bacterium]|nr:MAG: hypothetical protein D6785_04695 [Planctomycetota bacterium]
MNPYLFKGETLEEVLEKVRKELGENALILDTRYVDKKGIFGFGGEKWVEVKAIGERRRRPPQIPELAEVRSEVIRLREEIASIMRSDSKQIEIDPLHKELLKRGISHSLAKKLMSELEENFPHLQDPVERALKIRDLLTQKIKVRKAASQVNSPALWSFIGPTGVGKTTTIAKLAARFKLEKNLSVALFTLDTYRVGAVDQLEVYSQITEIPLKVIRKPEDIYQGKEEFQDKDIILVDTAGRSQKDKKKMEELDQYLRILSPTETHLVISSTTNQKSLKNILDHFLTFPVDHIILSKLDESTSFGEILSEMIERDLSFSFLTCGQEVPDDILEAKSDSIASLVAGAGE